MFNKYIEKVNLYLNSVFQNAPQYSQPLFEAMNYSLQAGGKRIRPVLTILAYKLFREDINRVLSVAASIEMVHTYSLIHDDLPAMDNDDYRRGKLTNHKVFGEAMAILAGDGLLTAAFEILTNSVIEYGIPVKIIRLIAENSGPKGMVGGQAADIRADKLDFSIETLGFIHKHKTSCLIEASVLSGAIAGDASQDDLSKLEKFAGNIGLAFQIEDDVLDESGDSKKLGKTAGKDKLQKKLTYPAFYGIEKSKIMAKELIDESIGIIKNYGKPALELIALAEMIIRREN